MVFLEPEHLRAAAEAEAEFRDHRRGLQPAAGRRRRDHVAGLVDDVEMHGVAAHLAEAADRGLAGAHGADRLAVAFLAAQLDDRAKAFDRAGHEIERGLVRDQLAALVVVGIGQQRRDRDFGEFRIAVKLLAVGKGELGAFDLQMDEFGPGGIEPVELEIPSAAQAAAASPDPGSRRRPCRRCSGHSHRSAALRRMAASAPCRRRESTPRCGEPLTSMTSWVRQNSSIASATKPCDQALRARFDLRDAVAAGAFGFLQDAGIGLGKRLVGEERAGFWHFIVGQIDRGRGGPVLPEQLLDGLDGRGARSTSG